jgi:hypothetical protein
MVFGAPYIKNPNLFDIYKRKEDRKQKVPIKIFSLFFIFAHNILLTMTETGKFDV